MKIQRTLATAERPRVAKSVEFVTTPLDYSTFADAALIRTSSTSDPTNPHAFHALPVTTCLNNSAGRSGSPVYKCQLPTPYVTVSNDSSVSTSFGSVGFCGSTCPSKREPW